MANEALRLIGSGAGRGDKQRSDELNLRELWGVILRRKFVLLRRSSSSSARRTPSSRSRHALADIIAAGALLPAAIPSAPPRSSRNAVTTGKISAGAVAAAKLADSAAIQANISADAVGPQPVAGHFSLNWLLCQREYHH